MLQPIPCPPGRSRLRVASHHRPEKMQQPSVAIPRGRARIAGFEDPRLFPGRRENQQRRRAGLRHRSRPRASALCARQLHKDTGGEAGLIRTPSERRIWSGGIFASPTVGVVPDSRSYHPSFCPCSLAFPQCQNPAEYAASAGRAIAVSSRSAISPRALRFHSARASQSRCFGGGWDSALLRLGLVRGRGGQGYRLGLLAFLVLVCGPPSRNSPARRVGITAP